MQNFGFGANKSKNDKRTIKHSSLTQVGVPLIKGGKEYVASDILNQSRVGICTAISLIQNRQKANGKKYSADFQYLLQKKFYDGNWDEGSSVLNALKVGNKYGFLPEELWFHTNPEDRNLPYSQYISELQLITDDEITRLLSLCVDKIAGYAQVDVSNPQNIAKAIIESEAGVICRYNVGKEWYTSILGTPSWGEKFISPLRPPKQIISGHAIVKSNFDLNMNNKFTLANTWSPLWCRNGSADIIWDEYKPDEVWVITKNPVITRFDKDLKFGMTGAMVVNLQNALKIKGFFNWNSSGFFGIITYLAVQKYQKANGIINTGFCGPLTRAQLNKDFN